MYSTFSLKHYCLYTAQKATCFGYITAIVKLVTGIKWKYLQCCLFRSTILVYLMVLRTQRGELP